MAGYISDDTRKVTTHRLIEMKQRGEKISMLTSYDYTMAQIVDGAGVDVILVGDSASNVMAGNVTTLPITLDQMIYHAKSVVRGVKRAMVVVDMPFGSYQGNELEGLASAIRIMKESHADALKLEGGEEIIGTVKRILSAGIPIMGHLGLMPQSINICCLVMWKFKVIFCSNNFKSFCCLNILLRAVPLCWTFKCRYRCIQKAALFNSLITEPIGRPNTIKFPTHTLKNFLPKPIPVTCIFGRMVGSTIAFDCKDIV